MPVAVEAVTAVDTSVALPLLLEGHTQHRAVMNWSVDRVLALSGHALAETYSVLTRLPGDLRVAPEDAARLLTRRFAPALVLDAETVVALPDILAQLGIAGGATYDGMVALAADRAGCVLATRDARAKLTYDAIGVTVEVVA
jgi:hypothetical protein